MKTILITGAGGSLGAELTRQLVNRGETVRALDTHEASLARLKHENTRLLLGDICDRERMNFALRNCDTCIACASYKNLDITEYSLEQTLSTNIFGTLTTAKECVNQKVKQAILISSDKAVEPVSAYGVSKTVQERIWLWMARIQNDTSFIIVRMGNFEYSSGSVLQVWQSQLERGETITVTSKDCDRFFISLQDAANFVLRIMNEGKNGQIYIPKMKQRRIYDMAYDFVGGNTEKITITGLREGEKISESLWSQYESTMVKDKGDYYVIEREI